MIHYGLDDGPQGSAGTRRLRAGRGGRARRARLAPGRCATRCGRWRRWPIAPAASATRATAAACRSTSRGGCGPIACARGCRSSPEFAVAHLAGADPEPALRGLGVELVALVEQDVDRAAVGPGGRDGTPPLWQAALRVPERASLLPHWLALEAAGVHVASLSRRPASTRCWATRPRCCRSPPTSSTRCSRPAWRSRTAATRPTRCPPSSGCSRSGASPTTARSTPSGGCGWSCPASAAQPLRGASDTQDLDLLAAACCSTAACRWTRCWRCCSRRCGRARPLDRYHRAVCGPLAQGPAALIGRSGELVVGAVDRLGLRPLWRLRTPGELWLSSEPGVLRHRRARRRPRARGRGPAGADRSAPAAGLPIPLPIEPSGRRGARVPVHAPAGAAARRPPRSTRPPTASRATTWRCWRRWPTPARSRSGRSDTTARWPRWTTRRPCPTTSSRRSRSSPTRPSTVTASASSSRCACLPGDGRSRARRPACGSSTRRCWARTRACRGRGSASPSTWRPTWSAPWQAAPSW